MTDDLIPPDVLTGRSKPAGERVPPAPDPRPRLEEFLRQAAANPMPTAPDDIEQLRARITTPSAAPDHVMAAIHAGHVGLVTIFCDECGVEETHDCTGETREERFAAARRYLATELGWIIAPDEDLCPNCKGGLDYPPHVMDAGGPDHYAAAQAQGLSYSAAVGDWDEVRRIVFDPYTARADAELGKAVLARAGKVTIVVPGI